MIAAIDMPPPAYHMPMSRASGPEARQIEVRLEEVATELYTSEAINRNRREAVRRLQEAASSTEFDDADAITTAQASILVALAFLYVLPDDVPAPVADFADDGEVTFEWIATRTVRLMISFSRTGELNYAALYPGGVSKGQEYFAGALPQTVSLALRRVLG